MEEEIQWICPICQSTKYKKKEENNHIDGPGFTSWILHYECNGCSIHFGDIEKFNVITMFGDIAEELLDECSSELLDKCL